MANEPSGMPTRLIEAVRQSALAALIAFGVLLPLVGLNTVSNIHNELVLETRPDGRHPIPALRLRR